MTFKPCIECSEISDRSRCPAHRPKDTRRHRGRGHTNDDPRMRRLSGRLRRMSPFCELCGATTDLTVDHIIPKSEAPGLIYNPANLRVLCRTCNSRRGTNVTDDERNRVYAAVEGRRQRLAGRRADSRSSTTRGDAPSTTHGPPVGKAESVLHTGILP